MPNVPKVYPTSYSLAKSSIHHEILRIFSSDCQHDCSCFMQQSGRGVPTSSACVSIVHPYYQTLEQAMKRSDMALGPVSKAASPRLKSVEIFTPQHTRGSEGNGLSGYYFVNFEEGGFRILSADCRRPPLIGHGEEGELHLADTLSNPGLNWYVNNCLPDLATSGFEGFGGRRRFRCPSPTGGMRQYREMD